MFPFKTCVTLSMTMTLQTWPCALSTRRISFVTDGESRSCPTVSLVCKQGQTLQHTDQTLHSTLSLSLSTQTKKKKTSLSNVWGERWAVPYVVCVFVVVVVQDALQEVTRYYLRKCIKYAFLLHAVDKSVCIRSRSAPIIQVCRKDPRQVRVYLMRRL